MPAKPTPTEIAEAVADAPTWNARVKAIRRIPEKFGTSEHAAVYAAIAKRVYVPTLQPDYAYVHWREEYELAPLAAAYELACAGTGGFKRVTCDDVRRVLSENPTTLRIFRLLVGFTGAEFAETCAVVAGYLGSAPLTKSRVSRIEDGGEILPDEAKTCAAAIDRVMRRDPGLFPPTPEGSALRLKIEKPDTDRGWSSVRSYASDGVPLPVLLHQRAYGGAFRQLSDATSAKRGDLIEEPVERMFREARVPFVRTGSGQQSAIAKRWGITVKPAPDFVLYDPRTDVPKAILECKAANDGGTARDKAARFIKLSGEGRRLGGIPLFAVLSGVGWRRTNDALGPVVQHTDGRVFTLATLREMLETEPIPGLRDLTPSPGP